MSTCTPQSNELSVMGYTDVPNESVAETIDSHLNKHTLQVKHANHQKIQLVWRNILFVSFAHLSAIYGVYLMITSAKIYTGIFGMN